VNNLGFCDRRYNREISGEIIERCCTHWIRFLCFYYKWSQGNIHTENRMERTKTARGPPPSTTIAQTNKVKSVCFGTNGAWIGFFFLEAQTCFRPVHMSLTKVKNLPTFSRNFLKTLLCMRLVLQCENSHIIAILVRTVLGGVIAFFDLDYCTQNSLIVIHSTF
jgi:hypothetical protein